MIELPRYRQILKAHWLILLRSASDEKTRWGGPEKLSIRRLNRVSGNDNFHLQQELIVNRVLCSFRLPPVRFVNSQREGQLIQERCTSARNHRVIGGNIRILFAGRYVSIRKLDTLNHPLYRRIMASVLFTEPYEASTPCFLRRLPFEALGFWGPVIRS